ncbi:DUF1304 domain-containing protein [Nocardia uniformis]|uniref:DUF1304 domain-containing protein n=1 Tax=Nocardia uniformis TaxID=53432 RepID=A0A849C2X9_9NOCA|nr:DUF1304 domain-containing protein [Nocardia uniformis]NNH73032.1 DUF1304 domain-containing protein [Nocardia uniformis]
MLTVVQILAGLAGVVHVGIFYMEVVRFTDRKVYRGTFGVADEDVQACVPWAFNQGFYNLFLAIGAFVGVALVRGNADAGWALILMSCGSMLAAAIVLVAKYRDKASAAAKQGLFPALTLLAALTQL